MCAWITFPQDKNPYIVSLIVRLKVQKKKKKAPVNMMTATEEFHKNVSRAIFVNSLISTSVVTSFFCIWKGTIQPFRWQELKDITAVNPIPIARARGFKGSCPAAYIIHKRGWSTPF